MNGIRTKKRKAHKRKLFVISEMETVGLEANAQSLGIIIFGNLSCSLSIAESQELNMLITVAKKRFVQEHHQRAISQMTNATGYKKDKWKSYVIVNDKRKEIIRNTEEELYASLYEHYSKLEKKPKTMEDVFEQMKDYKLNALARSQKTVDEDNRRFNKISTLLRTKSLNDITDLDIRNWFA